MGLNLKLKMPFASIISTTTCTAYYFLYLLQFWQNLTHKFDIQNIYNFEQLRLTKCRYYMHILAFYYHNVIVTVTVNLGLDYCLHDIILLELYLDLYGQNSHPLYRNPHKVDKCFMEERNSKSWSHVYSRSPNHL